MGPGIANSTIEMSCHILKYSENRTQPMLTEPGFGHGPRHLVYFKISFSSTDRQISSGAIAQDQEG